MTQPADHFVLICSTCQGPVSAQMVQEKLNAELPVGFATRLIPCMAGCDRPMTVGLQAADKAQYLFGDIADDTDLQALIEFAHQYRDSASGWTSASDRPPALFYKTLSRMPRPSDGSIS